LVSGVTAVNVAVLVGIPRSRSGAAWFTFERRDLRA
jgi:hypothetical protein